MRNDEKFTKGCEKVHSPPLDLLYTATLPGIYISTMVELYIHHGRYICPL